MADNLADAGGKVGRVPLVGDELTAPFDRAADAARALAEAGRDQQELVGQPRPRAGRRCCWSSRSALVLFGWLPLRLRWIRRASVGGDAGRRRPAGRDLLALRALATQPLRRLTRIGPDVADGAGGAATTRRVDALAALELRRLGLRGGRWPLTLSSRRLLLGYAASGRVVAEATIRSATWRWPSTA